MVDEKSGDARRSPPRPPTPRRRGAYRLLRRIVQVACLGAFLWLFRRTEYDGFTSIPDAASLLFRLDPLVGATVLLGAKAFVLSLLVPGLVLIALTFVLGRFFCGWVCPLGTMLDGARRVGRTLSRPRSPGAVGVPARASGLSPRWRRVRYYLLFAILAGAVVGVPILGLFDPFSILVRGLAFAVDPLLGGVTRGVFDGLYAHAPAWVTSVSEPVYGFVKARILAIQTHSYLLGGMSLAILLGVFALEVLGRRFWCRNLCPVGAILSLAARPSLLRRRPFKPCKGCGRCVTDCRMGAFEEGGGMAPEACTLCMDCVADCPTTAARFTFRSPGVAPAPFEPSRRMLLGAAGTGLALAAVAGLDSRVAFAGRPRPLRPPGVLGEAGFLDRCVRCGLCMKVCPTGALHPADLGAGWTGLFSPRIVPRLGYCELNCTLCGDVCPTGAIPRLDAARKAKEVIGKAEFDKSRCLPWARGEPCIVCEEHCPVPEKAIQVREVEVTNVAGTKVTIQQPWVMLDRCVGCGICENKCPLQGAAGIRVLHSKDAAITEEKAGY